MVGKDVKFTNFKKVLEMPDGTVDSEEFTIKCAIPLFLASERSRKVGTNDHLDSAAELLQW